MNKDIEARLDAIEARLTELEAGAKARSGLASDVEKRIIAHLEKYGDTFAADTQPAPKSPNG